MFPQWILLSLSKNNLSFYYHSSTTQLFSIPHPTILICQMPYTVHNFLSAPPWGSSHQRIHRSTLPLCKPFSCGFLFELDVNASGNVLTHAYEMPVLFSAWFGIGFSLAPANMYCLKKNNINHNTLTLVWCKFTRVTQPGWKYYHEIPNFNIDMIICGHNDWHVHQCW